MSKAASLAHVLLAYVVAIAVGAAWLYAGPDTDHLWLDGLIADVLATLDAAGVDVTAVRYNGMIHDYGLLNPLSNIPEVKAAMRQAAGELKAHLN